MLSPAMGERGGAFFERYFLCRCARTAVTITPTFATASRSVFSETPSSLVQYAGAGSLKVRSGFLTTPHGLLHHLADKRLIFMP